jgi:glycerol uptake facilitator-like aquaporin
MQAVFNFASCSIVSSALTNSGNMGALVVPQVMIGHFFLLFALVTATQPISGGHFNPMVSMAMTYWGVLQPARLLLYVTAQVAGGTLGSILQYHVLPPSLQDAAHAGVQVRHPP